MQVILKSGATLLILTAAVGFAGSAAAALVEDAQVMLDEHTAELESLEARWTALGVPSEMTAPVAAIPAVAQETLVLPEKLTQTATDILTQADLEGGSEITMTMPTTTTTAVTSTVPLTSTQLIATSSKIVALGALKKSVDGPAYLIEKAGAWQAGEDGFYVRVRFIDMEGNQTAFCTQYLSADGQTSWGLDVSQLEALPSGWEGIGLATVHDGLVTESAGLSEHHTIAVRSTTRNLQ